jgi:hypothetical protein
MKKFIYQMLLLFVLSTVSANAQVVIGTEDVSLKKHSGSILDLQSVEKEPYVGKGLLLPVVTLNDTTSFGLNGGDEDKAVGMIVYNTDSAIADGIYLWTKEPDKPGRWVIIASVEVNGE